MKKHWMIVLALLVFATGCNKKVAEDPADAARLEQIRAAVEKSNKAPRQSVGIPEAGGVENDKPKDAGNESDEKVKPEGSPKVDDDNKDGDAGAPEKTETSAKLNAKNALNDALAVARSENKALFVHFTAEW